MRKLAIRFFLTAALLGALPATRALSSVEAEPGASNIPLLICLGAHDRDAVKHDIMIFRTRANPGHRRSYFVDPIGEGHQCIASGCDVLKIREGWVKAEAVPDEREIFCRRDVVLGLVKCGDAGASHAHRTCAEAISGQESSESHEQDLRRVLASNLPLLIASAL